MLPVTGLQRFGYLRCLAVLRTQPLRGIPLPACVLLLRTEEVLLCEKKQRYLKQSQFEENNIFKIKAVFTLRQLTQ